MQGMVIPSGAGELEDEVLGRIGSSLKQEQVQYAAWVRESGRMERLNGGAQFGRCLPAVTHDEKGASAGQPTGFMRT